MSSPITVVGNNLSDVWGRAFLKVFQAGEISPLIVQINRLNNERPNEINNIRIALDSALYELAERLSCDQVANTIFPLSLWNRNVHRECLYERYQKICGHILRNPRNRNGVYFQRLISFGGDASGRNGKNQLEHVIETWQKCNRRRSALQAAVFNPLKDHTHQRRRGFPCLQQVAFAPIGNGNLSVTGFYATQYIFERAYGNYLGLCHLGQFMAQELNLRLDRVTCIASVALRSRANKGVLIELERHVREALTDGQTTRPGHDEGSND